MFHSLSPDLPDRSGYHSLSPLQHGADALDNNQAATETLISGNIYIYNVLEQRNLSSSCSIASMLDYHPGDVSVIAPLSLVSLIHPDDLNRVAEHFQRFITLRYDEVICIEYRMKHANGRWCWLRSQETPLAMAIDGFPLQILGIVQVAIQFSSIERSKWSNRCCEQRKVNLNRKFSY